MKKFLALMMAVAMLLSLCAFASADEGTGEYTVYNCTGETVTEVYLYPVGSEAKGDNLANWHGPALHLTYTADASTHLVLEFVTESGYVGHFDNLAIETAPISLLSADGMTGPTMISFSVPDGKGEYTFYNCTGEALAELYVYEVGSEDKGENFAIDFADGDVIEVEAPMDTKLVVEFVTESGYVGTFDKLSIEVAPISLLSADAMTGPTMISFFAPAAE